MLLAYIHLAGGEFTALLETASSALAPGGTLLVIGHEQDNLAHGYGGPQAPEVLHTADAIASEHPGLLAMGFAKQEADGLWRFPEYSYGRQLASLHPDTTASGSPK